MNKSDYIICVSNIRSSNKISFTIGKRYKYRKIDKVYGFISVVDDNGNDTLFHINNCNNINGEQIFITENALRKKKLNKLNLKYF